MRQGLERFRQQRYPAMPGHQPEIGFDFNPAKAKELLHSLLGYAQKLRKTKATIEYFATSLPTMLLSEDDLSFRQETTALFLQAQAQLGLGQKARGRSLLRQVLRRDPNHALARDAS